jgi:hypothetical protein
VKLVTTVIELPTSATASGPDYTDEIAFLQSLPNLTDDQLKNGRIGYPAYAEAEDSVKGISTRLGKAAKAIGIHVVNPTSPDKADRTPIVGRNLQKFSAKDAEGQDCVIVRVWEVSPAPVNETGEPQA